MEKSFLKYTLTGTNIRNIRIEIGMSILRNCFGYALKYGKKIAFADDEKQQYLCWIEELIAKRVNGIMEANRRNYYRECAAYIAALGEVVESRGEYKAKQRILMEYKTLYSRRRAFHRELRSYGMIDKK